MFDTYSYWEKKNFFDFDVILVGAGIVGLNAALTLKKLHPTVSIAILDAGFLPNGASTKNAGFACFGSISELIEQEKIGGTDGLHELIKKRWLGLKKLRAIVGDSNLNYENYGGYELFKNTESELAQSCFKKITHFNTLIKDITQTACVFEEANNVIEKIGFKTIDNLILNKLESQIDPGKMISALHTLVAQMGIHIFSNCRVSSYHPEAALTVVETNQGFYKCKKLIFCTNAFSKVFFPKLDLYPGRGQVIVTSPIEQLKLKGTFHYQQGFYYFRNVGTRVLLGGGRNLDFKTEETLDFGETPLVQKNLLDLLTQVILPNHTFTIDYKWSGIMAFGTKLEPIITEISPNIYCAARCNGMGIAIGSQTGSDIATLVSQSL